jgi:hypothetical protein
MTGFFLGRKPYWIFVAILMGLKVGLIVAIEYVPQTLSALRSIDTGLVVGLAIVVGARFADIGWSRWLGITLVVLIMLVLPVVLIFAAPPKVSGPLGSPLDALPDLIWISTVALVVLLVVAGSKRSALRHDSIVGVFDEDDRKRYEQAP